MSDEGVASHPVAWVAGATGYTGRAVVAALRAEVAMETWAHVRPDSPHLARWQERFAALGAHVDATPWDLDALAGRLAEVRPTLVFSLLGTTRRRIAAARRGGRPEESYETVDYGLTALLLQALRRAGLAPRFVYLSSLGVGAGVRNAYLQARWRFEEELRAGGLPFVIARPSFISGPDREERRTVERWAVRAGDAVFGLLARLGARGSADRYRSMTGEQLARALVSLALSPDAAGRIFDAAGLRAAASGPVER